MALARPGLVRLRRAMLLAMLFAAHRAGALDGAQDRSAWSERPIALFGVVGVGTPYGMMGAAVDASPHPAFAVAVGAGLGWGLREPQGALMPRVRLGGEENAVAASLGFSAGRYQVGDVVCLPDTSCNRKQVMAYWLNADAGYELRKLSGFSLYAFAGIGVVLNRSDVRDSGKNAHLQIPYAGVALGYAF